MTEILGNVNIPLWVYAATLVGFAAAGGICGFIVGRDVRQLREARDGNGRRGKPETPKPEIIANEGTIEGGFDLDGGRQRIGEVNRKQGAVAGNTGTGAVREPIRKPSKKSGRR